ncbi:MAG: rhodanese [Cycloclasticus sp. symbiont of Poecilosclerida sp. M]|nr:MAG: rhodanese [Cycloclasticus sp. symbiont of Poecilosclerida sp. M]
MTIIKIGIKELCVNAEKQIETITVDDALSLYQDEQVVVVDIRDIRELYRDGKIPGAYHAPRGMLEFWVDPESPYHKPIFVSGKRLVFYCGGGMRSALATQTVQMMGLKKACHIEGGFAAWRKANFPIEDVE